MQELRIDSHSGMASARWRKRLLEPRGAICVARGERDNFGVMPEAASVVGQEDGVRAQSRTSTASSVRCGARGELRARIGPPRARRW